MPSQRLWRRAIASLIFLMINYPLALSCLHKSGRIRHNMVVGGGGASGGAGANHQWEPFEPQEGITYPVGRWEYGPPKIPYNAGVELHIETLYYQSWWLSYPLEWEYDFESLCADLHGMLGDPDAWEIIAQQIFVRAPVGEGQRWLGIPFCEDVSRYRLDDVHYLSDSEQIHTCTLEFAVIEGNPRVKWFVEIYVYGKFKKIPPAIILPPPPPVLPILGMGQGSGTGFFAQILLLCSEGAKCRQKKI